MPSPASASPADPLALDLELLRGTVFACRPGCGLCCFAAPSVAPEEVEGLRRVAPALRLEARSGGYHGIPSRPDGGACVLLEGLRCRAHDVRPFPCRAFPIAVHLGPRAQATVVLSCPGLQAPLEGVGASEMSGLGDEVAAVLGELRRPASALRARGARDRWDRAVRRARAEGAWEERATLAEELAARAIELAEAAYPPELPSADEELATLPMQFSPAEGRVLLAEGSYGIVLRTVREGGGIERNLAEVPLPDELPHLDPSALARLRSYVRYHFRRDLAWGQALAAERVEDPETLRELLEEDAGWLAASAIARAAALALGEGAPAARLGRAAIDEGIRATDAEAIDRPTVGEML